MVGRGHGIIHPLEVAETVLEVADVAWSAVEHCRHLCHHGEHGDHGPADNEHGCASPDEELAALCSENRHLRSLLEQNLKLLQQLSQSPYLLKDCPPDLYTRLIATVDSKDFLTQLESLHQESRDATSNIFPFKEVTGDDLHSVEILINIDQEEPSWWVWVTDEMITEEWSGIDNESYVIVSEEHVVEGVANFIAKCIVSNPKAKRLSPEQLQKTVVKALGSVNKLEKMLSIWHAGKMFYALSTWGLAFAGLYRHRAILKVAAKGVAVSSKAVMRVL